MRLAKLKTENSNPLYVHPCSFISIYQKEHGQTIMVFKDDRIVITMPIKEVIEEINKALGNDRICPNCAMEKI